MVAKDRQAGRKEAGGSVNKRAAKGDCKEGGEGKMGKGEANETEEQMKDHLHLRATRKEGVVWIDAELRDVATCVRYMDEDRRAAAYHEAGHAVLMAIHGEPFEDVAIWSQDDGLWRGQVTASHASAFHVSLRDCVIDLFAGQIAEEKYTESLGPGSPRYKQYFGSELPRTLAEKDDKLIDYQVRTRLHGRVSRTSAKAFKRRCMERTQRIVQRHWTSIEGVARALLAKEPDEEWRGDDYVVEHSLTVFEVAELIHESAKREALLAIIELLKGRIGKASGAKAEGRPYGVQA